MAASIPAPARLMSASPRGRRVIWASGSPKDLGVSSRRYASANTANASKASLGVVAAPHPIRMMLRPTLCIRVGGHDRSDSGERKFTGDPKDRCDVAVAVAVVAVVVILLGSGSSYQVRAIFSTPARSSPAIRCRSAAIRRQRIEHRADAERPGAADADDHQLGVHATEGGHRGHRAPDLPLRCRQSLCRPAPRPRDVAGRSRTTGSSPPTTRRAPSTSISCSTRSTRPP